MNGILGGGVDSDIRSFTARLWPLALLTPTDEVWAQLARVQEGHERQFLAGRYEVAAARTLARSVVLRGRGLPVFSRTFGGAAPTLTVTGSDVTLEGLHFRNDSGSTTAVGLLVSGASRVTVRRCTFDGFRQSIVVTSCTGFRVEGCEVRNNAAANAIEVNGAALALSSRGFVVGNQVDKTAGAGYAIFGSADVRSTLYLGNNVGLVESIAYTDAAGANGNKGTAQENVCAGVTVL